MISVRELLPIANTAVDSARRLMLSPSYGEISAKGDRDMVSELDFHIEREVRAVLAERTPGIGFLGEEEGQRGSGAEELTWVLDPIDGTANFLRGLPLCAVSLALVQNGRPVLGVVDVPFLATRYCGVAGAGATLNGKAVLAASTRRLHDALVSLGDYAVGVGSEAKNVLRLAVTERLAHQVQRVRMLGSAAVDLTWVAAGRLDAAILLSNKPWDTSAGVIIAREAGARVVDLDGSDHTLTSGATIAAAPQLIEEILDLLRSVESIDTGSAAPT